MATHTRGLLLVHSSPSALCPHVEWAVGGVLGVPTHLEWLPQSAERGAFRAELAWAGEPGTAARLTSALKGWQRLRFEATEEASAHAEAHRYAYTPSLGVFHSVIGVHGETLVSEHRLRAALVSDALGARPLAESLQDLLGIAWDAELEIFRQAAEDAGVRWLHQVV